VIPAAWLSRENFREAMERISYVQPGKGKLFAIIPFFTEILRLKEDQGKYFVRAHFESFPENMRQKARGLGRECEFLHFAPGEVWGRGLGREQSAKFRTLLRGKVWGLAPRS